MSVKPRHAAPVLNSFLFRRWLALVRSERVERLKDQPAIVAKQLVHPDHAQEKDSIVVISLNPLTVTPWTPHICILATFSHDRLPMLKLIVDDHDEAPERNPFK